MLPTDWRGVGVGIGTGLVGGAALTLLPDPFIAWSTISFGTFVAVAFLLSGTLKSHWLCAVIGAVCGGLVFGLWWPIGRFARPLPPPRVEVVSVERTPLTDDLRFNVKVQNQGSVEVMEPKIHLGMALATGQVPRQAEDVIFQQSEHVQLPPKTPTAFLDEGQDRIQTIPSAMDDHFSITSDQLNSAVRTGQHVYITVNVYYWDKYGRKLWKTEWCQFYDYHLPDKFKRDLYTCVTR